MNFNWFSLFVYFFLAWNKIISIVSSKTSKSENQSISAEKKNIISFHFIYTFASVIFCLFVHFPIKWNEQKQEKRIFYLFLLPIVYYLLFFQTRKKYWLISHFISSNSKSRKHFWQCTNNLAEKKLLFQWIFMKHTK